MPLAMAGAAASVARKVTRPMTALLRSMRQACSNGAMRISPNAALNMASVKDQLDWFKSEKLVKDTITLDMLVDDSYTK